MEAEDFTTEAQRGISATDWGKSLPQKTTKKGKKRRGILTAKYAKYAKTGKTEKVHAETGRRGLFVETRQPKKHPKPHPGRPIPHVRFRRWIDSRHYPNRAHLRRLGEFWVMAFLQRGRTYVAAGRPRTNRARRRRGSGVGVLGNASRRGDVAPGDVERTHFKGLTHQR
jgi:hypothetical protein